MKAYQVISPDGIEAIERIERAEPEIQPDEILVRIKATSLNYRDLMVTQGGYIHNDVRPIIPLSDGSGEVVEVGRSVTKFKVGDRVAGNFFQEWRDGKLTDKTLGSALGGAIDGTLAEYAVFRAHGAVHIPEHLSHEEASTLPCAALTAWHALQAGKIKAGDTILFLGTGGVSIFGLQFAKAHGAEIIITSSSDEKLEKARELGADHIINYRKHSEWSKQVLKITDGRGVDNVLEVGGAGTLEQSIASTGLHGTISLIGLVAGAEMQITLAPALKMQNIQGIYVGSTAMFEAMNRAIALHQIKPVIDKKFAFDDAKSAYHHLEGATHVGKVAIIH